MQTGLLVNGRFEGRMITGVERYAREIICRLPGLKIARPRKPVHGLAGHLWEQVELPRLVADRLLWSPANTGPLAVERQVVTIHDTAVLDHPEWFQPGFALWYRILLPLLARRARVVHTVSSYTRGKLIRRLGLDPEKVRVTPGGVDRSRFHPLAGSPGSCRKYLLFLGSLQPRKNLSGLLEAWREIAGKFPDVELWVAGSSGRAFRLPGMQQTDQVRYLGYVTDASLPRLYAEAQAFIFPSFDEGFGLPVLEAMACGIPVIAAKAGAVPEVAGGAALLVNPAVSSEIGSAISRVLTDGAMRQDLVERGLERSACFSWDGSARAVQRVLEAV
jgi:glycosyltransferase involved in cell wall biosynthesis